MTVPSAAPGAPPVEAAVTGLPGFAAGAVLLLFLAAGLASTGWAIATGRLDLLAQAPTLERVREGLPMREIAASLARAPLPAGAATAERQASWLALRDLGPQVRQGCPGWLYLADELRPHAGADAASAARARVVAQVRDRLAQRNIALAVVLVPDKSRVVSAQLCGLHRPAAFAPRLEDFGRSLAAAGVVVADTTAALQAVPASFLRTDTHWSEAGAQSAAQAVAARVRTLGLALQPARQWQLTPGPVVPRPGDLVRLAGLDALPAALQPPPEGDTRTRFAEASAAPAGAAPARAAEDDLFGDSQLPQAVLVGTSFSNTSQFPAFLAAALGTPVANFARDGGNFWGSADAYFKGPAFRDTPPRLVVWEIPERTLQMPVDGERWSLP